MSKRYKHGRDRFAKRRQMRRVAGVVRDLGIVAQVFAILFGDHNVSSQTKKQDHPPAKTPPGFISDIDFEDIKKIKNDNC